MEVPDWAYLPWFAWIALAGIFVGGAIAIVKRLTNKNTEMIEAVKQNTAVNERLLEKLEGIDGRLGAVEKTLNDIPG